MELFFKIINQKEFKKGKKMEHSLFLLVSNYILCICSFNSYPRNCNIDIWLIKVWNYLSFSLGQYKDFRTIQLLIVLLLLWVSCIKYLIGFFFVLSHSYLPASSSVNCLLLEGHSSEFLSWFVGELSHFLNDPFGVNFVCVIRLVYISFDF